MLECFINCGRNDVLICTMPSQFSTTLYAEDGLVSGLSEGCLMFLTEFGGIVGNLSAYSEDHECSNELSRGPGCPWGWWLHRTLMSVEVSQLSKILCVHNIMFYSVLTLLSADPEREHYILASEAFWVPRDPKHKWHSRDGIGRGEGRLR